MMDRRLGGAHALCRGGIDVACVTHDHRDEPHKAVHEGDELGHLRHLHRAREIKAYRGADDLVLGELVEFLQQQFEAPRG